jgi:signal transduction histidine kinase
MAGARDETEINRFLADTLATMAGLGGLSAVEVRWDPDGSPVLRALHPSNLPAALEAARASIIQAVSAGREGHVEPGAARQAFGATGRTEVEDEASRSAERDASNPGWVVVCSLGGTDYVVSRGLGAEAVRDWAGQHVARLGDADRNARCLAAMGEGHVLVDGAGRVEVVSPIAAAMMGVDAGALEGRASRELWPELPSRVEENEVARGSLERTRPDLAYQVSARRGGGEGVWVRFRRHEDGGSRRARQAQFVSALRHDVRSPLTSLRGLVGVLSAEPDMSDEDRTRMVSLLQAEVERMVTWVEDYLVVLWLRHEPRPAHVIERAAWRLVEDACEMFEAHARSRGIDFQMSAPEHAAETPVRVDPSLVAPFLRNLVGHFFRLGERGAEIRVGLDAHGSLIVEGRGPGLFAGHTAEPFMTISRSTASGKRTPGVGLGLFIVKKIADVHGWPVRCEVLGGLLRVNVGWACAG